MVFHPSKQGMKRNLKKEPVLLKIKDAKLNLSKFNDIKT